MKHLGIAWPRLFAESAAIVASILFAFAIDAWWDNRQGEQREHSQIQALKVEFEGNLELLQSDLSRIQEANTSLLELMSRLTSVTEGETVEITGRYLLYVQMSLIADPATGTLNALINSGDLGLLRDDSLKASLSDWLTRVVELQADQQSIRNVTNNDLIPYLGSLGDFSMFILPGEKSESTLADPIVIRSTGRLRTTLANKILFFSISLNKFEQLVSQTETIVNQLESNLK